MPTIEELFGDSESEEEEDDNEIGKEGNEKPTEEYHSDGEAFEKEWARAEQRQQERERIEQCQRSVASRYQKHPPREIGAEKWEGDPDCSFYYDFVGIYPHLFEVARTRVSSLLSHENGRLRELQAEAFKMTKLPCSALEFYGDDDGNYLRCEWTPQLRTILEGTREIESRKRDHDSDRPKSDLALSPLVLLRNHESTLVRLIFSFLSHYGNHVTMTIPAEVIMNLRGARKNRFGLGYEKKWKHLTSDNSSYSKGSGYVAFSKVGQVLDLFPQPAGRNVNMMPFVLGNQESLPDDLQCYYPLIDACPFLRDEFGKVAFLTVQESESVQKNKSQRRPGLHIESPGVFADSSSSSSIAAKGNPSCSFTPGEERHHWGRGSFRGPDRYEGGIYLASSVDGTTAVWDALVDSSVPGIVDRQGGIDHLKPLLPDSSATQLRAGDLVWMTDCTPHEALPQSQEGPRTFFRLVMPYVTHWYAAHSTPNPKVPIPESIAVVDDNKFVPMGKMDRKGTAGRR